MGLEVRVPGKVFTFSFVGDLNTQGTSTIPPDSASGRDDRGQLPCPFVSCRRTCSRTVTRGTSESVGASDRSTSRPGVQVGGSNYVMLRVWRCIENT